QVVDDANREDQIEVLGGPVVLGGGVDLGATEGADEVVAAELDVGEAGDELGHEALGDGAIDEDGLDGVAHAGALDLGVLDDGEGDGEIGGGVDVDVAHALVVLDHRDAGVIADVADQALAAAWDAEVDEIVEPDEVGDGFAIGCRDELDSVGRELGGGEAVHDRGEEGTVALEGFAAAAQDAGVARLEAEGGGVGGYVGARLVDHGDHAQRDPDALDLEAVGADLGAFDLAEDRGGSGDVGDGAGETGDALVVEAQAVDHGRGQARGVGGGEIPGVGSQDGGAVSLDRLGDGDERARALLL